MVESAKAVAMDIGNREKVEKWEEANGQVGQLNVDFFVRFFDLLCKARRR